MTIHEPAPHAPGRRPVDLALPEGAPTPKVAEHDWLMVEWDWERNDAEGVRPERRTLLSAIPTWWLCRVCGVSWEMSPKHRYETGRNCPNLCVPMIQAPISLTHPELAERLVGHDPETVFVDSPDRYDWKCEEGHLSVGLKVRGFQSRGCRECARDHSTLLDSEHAVHLDPAFMETIDSGTRTNSKESVRWLCEAGHSYSRRVVRYVQGDRGCPICSGRIKGLLVDLFPEIAAQWSPENDRPVDGVAAYSWDLALWKCHRCGCEWEANVANRTNRGSGCPECWKRRGSSSLLEQSIRSGIEVALGETLDDQRTIYCSGGRRFRVDMVTHDDIVIEYDSAYWHWERQEWDEERSALITAEGFTVVHVREVPLAPVGPLDIEVDHSRDTLPVVVERITARINEVRSARDAG